MSLSYFTANYSFLPKAGMHAVLPQKLKILIPVHSNADDTNDTDNTDDADEADGYNRVIGIAEGFRQC